MLIDHFIMLPNIHSSARVQSLWQNEQVQSSEYVRRFLLPRLRNILLFTHKEIDSSSDELVSSSPEARCDLPDTIDP